MRSITYYDRCLSEVKQHRREQGGEVEGFLASAAFCPDIGRLGFVVNGRLGIGGKK